MELKAFNNKVYTELMSATWQDAVISVLIILFISLLCGYLAVLYIFGSKDE